MTDPPETPPKEEDPNILGDAETELWEKLNDYTGRPQIITEERENYGRVIWTLHVKFGYPYPEMSTNIDNKKSAQALRNAVDRILGKLEPPQKLGTRKANAKIGEIVGKAAGDRVITNQELGEWLHDTYGPIALGMGIDIKQLIAEAMDYYITVRPEIEESYEMVVQSDIATRMINQQLMEYASPNFLMAEKMRNITEMMELVAVLKAQGLPVPKELLPATMRILEELDTSNFGM